MIPTASEAGIIAKRNESATASLYANSPGLGASHVSSIKEIPGTLPASVATGAVNSAQEKPNVERARELRFISFRAATRNVVLSGDNRFVWDTTISSAQLNALRKHIVSGQSEEEAGKMIEAMLVTKADKMIVEELLNFLEKGRDTKRLPHEAVLSDLGSNSPNYPIVIDGLLKCVKNNKDAYLDDGDWINVKNQQEMAEQAGLNQIKASVSKLTDAQAVKILSSLQSNFGNGVDSILDAAISKVNRGEEDVQDLKAAKTLKQILVSELCEKTGKDKRTCDVSVADKTPGSVKLGLAREKAALDGLEIGPPDIFSR